MSDIYLKSAQGETDIVIINGVPQLTDGLDNAVYLSLFTPEWWGNEISESSERYNSRIPQIVAERLLTNQTRLDVIEEAKNALDWMLTDGIAERIEVDAEIPRAGQISLAVRVFQPLTDTPLTFRYALSWDAQKTTIQEATW